MVCDLLCTAEDFGFGPAAALSRMVPHLLAQGLRLEYVGAGITLDLHANLGYQAVHRAQSRDPQGRAQLSQLLRARPALLSVCDVNAASIALDNTPQPAVILYDILAWFRRPLPSVYQQLPHILCPNFFGVADNLRANDIHHAKIVPPLIPAPLPANPAYASRVLVNLGGLHTPYTSDAECAAYAQLIVDTLRRATGDTCPTVLTSRQIGAHLHNCNARTATGDEARQWLASCELAFMTPGLGNMFDAAGQGARVCFLPPMSDSQGLQAQALRQRQLIPVSMDWHDITGASPIDWWAPKSVTVPLMVQAMQQVAHEAAARQRLCDLLQLFCEKAPGWDPRATLQAAFQQAFGSDDGSQAAQAIVAALHREPHHA